MMRVYRFVSRRRPWPALAALLVLGGAVPARGDTQVYQCTDVDGGVSYSQMPCPASPGAAPAVSGTARPAATGPDCYLAEKFATTIARYMRAGADSGEVFSRYGGIDSLSRGAVNVINYVYTFRTNESVSVERIAGLSAAKCQAKAFGTFACRSLPPTVRNAEGACAANDDDAGIVPPPPAAAPATSPARPRVSYARAEAEDERSKEDVERCKKLYRNQIEAIDEQMRAGYTSEQGERYRTQLRGLSQKMLQCE